MSELNLIERALPHGTLRGVAAPGLDSLVDEFAANFSERGEVGASLCVMRNGEPLLDIWGGIADAETARPWERDTVSIVFSNTKPATALCLHLLADRGLVQLDELVTKYWPGYGCNGKAGTTLRMLLDHSAGLPALRHPLEDGEAFDWAAMVARLEAEQPFWEPGARSGYHGLTFGWLVGEVVRRVSGSDLGTFFNDSVAGPLGLDFWIGLPEEKELQVAPVIPYKAQPGTPRSRFDQAVATEVGSISGLYFVNTGGWRPSGFNTRRGRAAQIGAANGITNARGLAGFYSPLARNGEANGRQLISPHQIREFSRVSTATHDDATLRIPTRFAAGFMVRMDNRARGLDSALFPDGAFGHVGAGGSVGFADPARRLSFGYTMNRMGAGLLLNERGQCLIDRLYEHLDQMHD